MEHISRVAVFIEVVKQGSFVGAGRALGLSGPAVSKQIQSLEAKLGVKLLNRTTRHVGTTEEGAVYFERASKVLADLAEAEQQVQESKECPTGKLKLNAPMSFGIKYLCDPLSQFALRYPDVELDVDFDDRWVDVVGEGYDLVVRVGSLGDSSLVARQLGSCPIILCASPGFLKRHGTPSSPDDISELPAVVYSQHGKVEDWNYRDGSSGDTGSVRLNRTMSTNAGELELAACVEGVGIALLPIFLATEHLESGELVQLLPGYTTVPERGIYALYPQNRFLATRVRLLLDFLLECSESYPWKSRRSR